MIKNAIIRQEALEQGKRVFKDSESYDDNTIIGYYLFIDSIVHGATLTENDVCISNLENLLKQLSKHYYSIIKMYYLDNLTYRECGKILGISCERVRQIKERTIKLVENKLSQLILSKQRKLSDAKKQFCNSIQQGEIPTIDIPISDLNFSIKTYNALTKAGINTLYQLYKLPHKDLTQIKNLGPYSLKEVDKKLQDIAIEINPGPLNTSLSSNDITVLPLCSRTLNALRRARIYTISQLFSTSDTELLAIRNFGKACLNELQKVKQSLLDSGYSVPNAKVNYTSDTLIVNLQLSTRTSNSLRRAEITKLYQLLAIPNEELLHIRGFGKACLNEVIVFKEKLSHG